MSVEQSISVPEASSDRDQRMQEVLSKLDAGTEAAMTSEGFQKWLKLLSHMHHYSYSNVTLIFAQMPEATMVNSYERWKETGRQVNKGEKAIKIFYPKFKKQEDPVTGEEKRKVYSFGLGNVFDISQTSGEPLPERLAEPVHDTSITETGIMIYDSLKHHLDEKGIPVEQKPLPKPIGGYWDPQAKKIAINLYRSLEYHSNVKSRVLVHEAAHYTANHNGRTDRADAEAVAEGSAYSVMYHFGLDTGEYSFPYLANWTQDMEMFRRNMSDIQVTTHTLISAIENANNPETAPSQP